MNLAFGNGVSVDNAVTIYRDVNNFARKQPEAAQKAAQNPLVYLPKDISNRAQSVLIQRGNSSMFELLETYLRRALLFSKKTNPSNKEEKNAFLKMRMSTFKGLKNLLG